ncbi:helix-turn-helix domain-containing protein [Pseudomonas aeruginosa]|uniref:helix-turn-helix domain-containing protein n=1 Tax=Pseudomonas aeruginosa TaxID=287 RepID=UPI00046D84F7|nr:helix-turn-helix domain-containing protein [Pseudomonas aeruginosa]KSH97896.1 hypothetical protein AO979_09155 [Pseudomonas aeruginosa]MBG3998627.1 helix-turn-helix domain-containing protein [Pseudomonas aeruginosa]MBG4125936.1 helix-turn-helix domain-containing protein [Pseudomonas aeruginosa]MCS7587124.1 helix-turn-helix domain-containing protein [Pseudomonas aeruginosa]PBM93003.1 hypothetical protein B8B59_08985 [Pseudomonas aeruginosa]
MTDPIHDYDPAQALEGREAIAVFIADALGAGDAAYIAKGHAVDIQGIPPEVVTREAAALLNLSRLRLLRLLDDGEIASRIIDGRRRVQVADLVTFKQSQAQALSAAMDELTRESERLNLGY